MQLEERKGQGYARYISKRDIIGTVVLAGNPLMFKEASSRDAGLIQNEAFSDLFDYLRLKVLRRLERYVEGVIDFDAVSARTTSDRETIEEKSIDLVTKLVEGTKGPDTRLQVGPGLFQTLDENMVSKYPSILKNLISLRDHVQGEKDQVALDTAIRAARHTLAKAEKTESTLASSLAAKEREVFFLTGALTSDKANLLRHLHSIKLSSQEIEEQIKLLVDWTKSTEVPQTITNAIGKASIEAKKILMLSRMAPSANFDLGRDLIETDIVEFTKQYFKQFGVGRKDVLQPIQIYNDNLTFTRSFNPAAIAIVLDNLVDNSRKNTADQISVKYELKNRELHLVVGDNGKGISDDVAPHIFELGYSGTGGTGMGLYDCHEIMRTMGGEIKFLGNAVEGLGTGACFEVVFK
ncbi:MAG: sensor histidine kinase [Nitrososphaerales archaeon]